MAESSDVGFEAGDRVVLTGKPFTGNRTATLLREKRWLGQRAWLVRLDGGRVRAATPTTVETTVVERVMQHVPSGDGGEFERARAKRDRANDEVIDFGLRLLRMLALALVVRVPTQLLLADIREHWYWVTLVCAASGLVWCAWWRTFSSSPDLGGSHLLRRCLSIARRPHLWGALWMMDCMSVFWW